MRGFQCGFCDKVFTSSLEMWLHTLESHAQQETKINDAKEAENGKIPQLIA